MEHECIDHKGRKYKSITEMCKHWGISRDTYLYRIKIGKSVEYALTAMNYASHKGIAVKDHMGNEFDSIKDMLEYWGIFYPTLYYNRKKHGWTLEEILTGERKKK